MQITNPATGEVLADVPIDDAASVDAAVRAARDAQPSWAARPIGERLAVLRRYRELLDEGREELAQILCGETGKPISQARNEVAGTLGRIDYFCDEAEAVLASTTVAEDGAMTEVVALEPLGVVANVSAWNYPWFVGTNVVVPALAAGNAVVYKPSEYATRTGLEMARRLTEAGVPPGVFTAVVGGGDVGAALVQAQVDGVFFTGSEATGRRIAAAVADRLIRVQLELGGKDPVYVADDVDVEAAAASLADGAFYNNGQSCCSVERIYVHEAVADEFVDRFLAVVDGFVMGDPTDESTYLGPLTRPQQADVLDAQVADAVAKGATVRCGGGRVASPPTGAGVWFAPTVLTGVDRTMELQRDESFGPIIGIEVVADDDAAIAAMNDTRYGLTAGVYSTDRVRAEAILRRVHAGTVYWNCCDRVSPRLPWSGRGASGIGSTLGTIGILTFVQPKAWHLRAG